MPGAPAGRFQNSAIEDSSIPSGTIRVEVRGPDGKPMQGVPVKMGKVLQSVAKGESRVHELKETSPLGVAEFSGQEVSMDAAYRISVAKDGGSFAATPFRLSPGRGTKVILHVLPVSHERGADVLVESFAHFELKEDRVQIVQVFRVINRGAVTWVPEGVYLDLPEGHTGFQSNQQMSDQGFDLVGSRAKFRGTFGPGDHTLEARWQLLWSGGATLEAALPILADTARMRIIALASETMTLGAEGFERANRQRDEEGQELLVSERLRPLTSSVVRVKLGGLPATGPTRWYVALAVSIVMLVGIWKGLSRDPLTEGRSQESNDGLRSQLLDELVELEKARARGDIGPKTHETLKRNLMEQLARLLLHEDRVVEKGMAGV